MDESDAGGGGPSSPPENTEKEEQQAAAALKARSGGRRRSCNRCSAKKERCDGQEPCERCTRSGLECLYATCRTLGRPRNSSPVASNSTTSTPSNNNHNNSGSSKRRAGSTAAASACAISSRPTAAGGGVTTSSASVGTITKSTETGTITKSTETSTTTATSRATPVRSSGVTQRATAASTRRAAPRASAAATAAVREEPVAIVAGARAGAALLPLKRVSLAPSPATGLSGLIQNSYLTCFMDDFLTLYCVLDDATVRLGLINLMTGKVDAAAIYAGFIKSPPASPAAKRSARGVGAPGRRDGDRRSVGTAGAAQTGRKKAIVSHPGPAPAGVSVRGKSLLSQPLADGPSQDDYAINSAFFSAMTIGAILLGELPADVEEYALVAEASLRVCGALAVPASNKRVAVAQLLLALSSNVAGKSDYPERLVLARESFAALSLRGMPTPRPIKDILNYRKIIDALGGPKGSTRVPPPRVEAVSGGPAGTGAAERPTSAQEFSSATISPGQNVDSVSNSRDIAHDERPNKRPVAGGLGNNRATLGGRGIGAASVQETGGSSSGSAERKPSGKGEADQEERPQSGLEAARERSRLRVSDSLLMVADILSMLSKVPWSMKTEEGARKVKEQLFELRALLVSERALLEERRVARGKLADAPSEAMAVFVLSAAFIGLHCALEEFSKLLPHAESVAKCISDCPGIARYQVHGYHTALTVFRAYGKRKEFKALVLAAPTELRCATPSNRPLLFDTEEDMCTLTVCRRHCEAIVELASRYHKKASLSSTPVATSSSSPFSVPSSPLFSPPVPTVEIIPGRGQKSCPKPGVGSSASTQPDRRQSESRQPPSPPLVPPAIYRPVTAGAIDFEQADGQVRRKGGASPVAERGSECSVTSGRTNRRSFSLPWEPAAERPVSGAASPMEAVEGPQFGQSSPFAPLSGTVKVQREGHFASPTDQGGHQWRQQQPLPPYSHLLPQLTHEGTTAQHSSGGMSSSTTQAAATARIGSHAGDQQILPFPEVMKRVRSGWQNLCQVSPAGDIQGHRSGGGGLHPFNGRLEGLVDLDGDGDGRGEISLSAATASSLRRNLQIQGQAGPPSTWGVSIFGDAEVRRGWPSPPMGDKQFEREAGGSEPCFSERPHRNHFQQAAVFPGRARGQSSTQQHRGTMQHSMIGDKKVPAYGATATAAGVEVGREVEDLPHGAWEMAHTASVNDGRNSEAVAQRRGVVVGGGGGGAPSFWQWPAQSQPFSSSPPQLISAAPSPAPASSITSTLQNGPLLEESAPLSSCAVVSTAAFPSSQATAAMGLWRGDGDRLFCSPSPLPVGGAEGLAAVSPAGSASRSPGSEHETNRVAAACGGAGDGGQEDSMLRTLWEIMDNGDNP